MRRSCPWTVIRLASCGDGWTTTSSNAGGWDGGDDGGTASAPLPFEEADRFGGCWSGCWPIVFTSHRQGCLAPHANWCEWTNRRDFNESSHFTTVPQQDQAPSLPKDNLIQMSDLPISFVVFMCRLDTVPEGLFKVFICLYSRWI